MKQCEECQNSEFVRNLDNFVVCTNCGLVRDEYFPDLQYIPQSNSMIRGPVQRILSYFGGYPWTNECCDLVPRNVTSIVTVAAAVCNVAKRHNVAISPKQISDLLEIRPTHVLKELEDKKWSYMNWDDCFCRHVEDFCVEYDVPKGVVLDKKELVKKGNPKHSALALVLLLNPALRKNFPFAFCEKLRSRIVGRKWSVDL